MADLREYRSLDGIEFSPDVRKLMSLFAECWEECHADDCTTCKYRHGRDHYKLMYCLSERYAEKLISNDVAPVVHSYWEHKITSCEENISICHNCKYPVSWFWGLSKYCPNCGAKMDGGTN